MEELDTITKRITEKMSQQEGNSQVSEPLSKSDIIGLYEKVRDRYVIGELSERPEVRLLDKLIYCGVPKRFLYADISLISASLRKQIEGFDVGKGYYLWGTVGTGKTYLICALVRSFLLKMQEKGRLEETRRLPKITSVPAILSAIKDSFDEKSNETEKGIIMRYSSYPCLILDDLGVEKPSEWVMQTLYSIIDNRYKDDMQTVFTSNLGLDRIQDRIGERIPSRIAEMCEIVQIKGADRRIKK